MKKAIYTGIVLFFMGLISFILVSNKKKNDRDTAIVAEKNNFIAVRVEKAKEETIIPNFIANGIFEPLQILHFSVENTGRVTEVLVDAGSVVEKGQTLAIMEGDNLQIEVQKMKAAYRNALSNKQRYMKAFETGGVTRQQLDQANLNLVTAKAKLDQILIKYRDRVIKSPIDGVVNKRNIDPGSLIIPGAPLFELVNISTLKLKVSVDENQIADLELGETVKVRVSAYQNQEFEGVISFISPKADVSLNFPVEIEIVNNSDNVLKAGMFGTAVFSSQKENQKSMITISRNAFVGSVSSNEVFIIKNKIAHLVKIVPGRSVGNRVTVLDGLFSGDTVVVSGQINLTDGAKVMIVQ